MRLRPSYLPVLFLVALGGLGASVGRAADSPPENPFHDLAQHLRLGRTVRTRGALVLALRLDEAFQPKLDAKVGLQGTRVEILPLPGPAGEWHVRVANREPVPLLVPAGETLLTPIQASRSADRPVWIAPGAATFLPVVQAVTPPPRGPYVSRHRGLTPFELSLIPSDRWADRVRARNQHFAVPHDRINDAGAAYATPAFESVLERYRAFLDDLVDGKRIVGIVVADNRGPVFAHIETDAKRFADHWPFLRAGIALDAAMLESVGGVPRPGDDGKLRAIVKKLLRTLLDRPLRRPTFGEGWEYRWNLDDPSGRWDGLGLREGPVCLTLHREPPLLPGAPPTPGTTGTNPPEATDPGLFETERRVRETEFEKRLRERRERARNPGGLPRSNGGATSNPPAPAPPPPRTPPPSTPPPRTPSPPDPGGGLPGRR